VPSSSVDELLVLAGAERGNDHGLGLAAGEQRRTVGTRQEADLGGRSADRGEITAVDAGAWCRDGAADDFGFQRLELFAEHVALDSLAFGFADQRLDDLRLGGVDRVLALGLDVIL
jgi:hypothetical protein